MGYVIKMQMNDYLNYHLTWLENISPNQIWGEI